uniref:Nucleolar complex protein 2 homolog n=1 Tax=Alexandrium catenella TaxID=2925 RepID=A0A7S1RLJ2_ALECA
MKALEDSGDEADAGARHEQELKAIKEKDPEFYKFLVESDKSLLDFRAPTPAEMAVGEEEPGDDEEDEEEDAEETKAKAKKAAGAAQAAKKVLTPERLHRIQDTVMDSFTSCKAALNIYHTAVRSIEGRAMESTDPAWKEAEAERKAKEEKKAEQEGGKKPKPKPKRSKARPGLLEIEDEAIFSEVIEWSLTNLLAAFHHHAGKLRKGSAPNKKRQKQKGKKGGKKEDEEFDVDPGPGAAVDVRRYARWLRVQVLVKIFWDETFFLLNHLVGQQMIEYLLRNISGPQAISWLWPFKKVRSLFIKKCILVWSQAPTQPVRLLAFLFLRNLGAMALQERESTVKKTPLLDDIIRTMVKGFAQAASAGFTWRSINSFRVMENSFVEMLRLDDSTAYRLGYVCIRQLAIVLRNACIAVNSHTDHSKSKGQATSMARGKNKKELTEKQRKKRAHYQQAAQSLVAWPFIRGVYLWTKAVGTLPSLRELAYPLSMVIMGAVKSQISKIQMFPFVYHCLLCQNRLGASLGVYVPISSHLMKCFEVMNIAIDKAFQKRRSSAGKDYAGVSQAKAPEVEVLTHFGEGQRYDSLTLEAVGGNLMFLLADHMGLLSQSPAFPELVSIVLIHVRKHRKHCGSEAMRRQLTTFIQAAEATAEQVRLKREALTEAPSFKKFLIFDADTQMAKLRVTMTKRKADEEKQRIEAETRDDGKPEGDDAKGDKNKKKQRKGRRQREAEEAAAEAEGAAGEAAKPAKKRRRKGGKEEAPADQKEDKVEEMAFSSGED